MAWDDDDDESDDAGFDTSGDDDDATAPCPSCGAENYDDAERCPKCGRYQSCEDSPRPSQPWWIIAGVIICLAIVVLWVVRML